MADGKQAREPEKAHLVKGFHRCLELLGQYQFCEEVVKETLAGIGLLVVEGPNDMIALSELGVPSVGICSNTITREQAAKAAELVRDLVGGVLTLKRNCDAEGDNGGKTSSGRTRAALRGAASLELANARQAVRRAAAGIAVTRRVATDSRQLMQTWEQRVKNTPSTRSN